MGNTRCTLEVRRRKQPGTPHLEVLTPSVCLQHQALVVAQVLKHEASHVSVVCVLPHQDFSVAVHAAAEAEQDVEGPPYPLRQAGVTHRSHAQAYVEVPAPQGHVAKLLLRTGVQNDVVHQYADLSRAALLLKPFLLL